MRGEIADLLERVADVETTAEELPHRRADLGLVTEFLRGLLQLHLDWIEDVERELAPASGAAARR